MAWNITNLGNKLEKLKSNKISKEKLNLLVN